MTNSTAVSSATKPRLGSFLVGAYLAALLLELIAVGLWMIRANRDWGYPEWLINYQGHFIRRGFQGAVIRVLAQATHLNPYYFVALAGISCYVVLFAVAWKLFAASSRRWWVIALVTCPATLAFPVVSRTSFRKDILFFALLALLIQWLRAKGEGISNVAVAGVLSVCCPLLILCQEPLVMYYPYCAAALLICLRSFRRVALLLTLPILLSGVAAVAAATHSGRPDQLPALCASVGQPDVDTCSAGIVIVAQSKQVALDAVDDFVARFSYVRQYSISVLLFLVPVAGALLDLRRRPESRHALRLVGAAALVSIPLTYVIFRYGVDWGRWINLHTVCITLLLLLVDSRRSEAAASAPGGTAARRFAVGALLVVYATCWSMPGTRDKPRLGYLSLASRLVHWNGSLTN